MLLEPESTRQHRREADRQEQDFNKGREHNIAHTCTSLSAHMRVIEPMLFVMVTSVALARSSLETESLFSLDIMFPKL